MTADSLKHEMKREREIVCRVEGRSFKSVIPDPTVGQTLDHTRSQNMAQIPSVSLGQNKIMQIVRTENPYVKGLKDVFVCFLAFNQESRILYSHYVGT